MADKDLSVNQRIKFLIDNYSKLTQRAFAERIGVSQSAVSSLFSQRENRPGLEMLQKIAVAYPEISLDWLLVGQGNMLKQVGPISEADKLESLVKKILDERQELEKSADGKATGNQDVSSQPRLIALLHKEEQLRSRLVQLESSTAGDSLFPWVELDTEKRKAIASEITDLHAEYMSTIYSRMLIERAMLRQEASTLVYRVTGEPDPSQTYGGLLSIRLGISDDFALSLVKNGHVRAAYIDGEGYRVTERACREFLGEV